MHYLGHPIVGLGGLGLEIYGGGRAVPARLRRAGVFHHSQPCGSAPAWIFNAESNERDFILKLDLPVRRGGIVGAGSAMTVRWIPTRDQTFTVGVSLPFGDPRRAGPVLTPTT